MRKKTITIKKYLLLIILLLIGAISGVTMLFLVEETGTPEYCASCHEMELFFDAWNKGPHGSGEDGAIEATCVECHLPHEGTINYLLIKARSGANDTWAHLTSRKTDWKSNLEDRNHYTFDSGCRKCHIELVVPGIPLKAINAHRDYTLGETEKTCSDCHTDAGHGDLPARFMETED